MGGATLRAGSRPDLQGLAPGAEPARRAQPAGRQPAADLDHRPPQAQCPLLQQPDRPAGVVDRLRRPGPGQSGHGQVLHLDHLVIANHAVGQPVVCVQAGRGDLTMLDSKPTCHLGTPLRLFALAAGALCPRASALRRRCPGLSMTSPPDKTASHSEQSARVRQPNVADLRDSHTAGGGTQAVAGQPDPGPVLLAGPEPGAPDLAALACTRQGVEPAPLRPLRVPAGLHERHRRDPAQPLPGLGWSWRG
jgi:hypothetical protein